MKDKKKPDQVTKRAKPVEDYEEIIELIEVVETPPIKDESVTEPAKEIKESEDDEEIIKLVDFINDVSGQAEKKSELTADALGMNLNLERDISEDLSDTDQEGEKTLEELGITLEPEGEAIEFEPVEADLVEESQALASVPQVQVEAAIERVINKMFSEKIEPLIVEVIEKAFTKEIERLKGILIEDATDIGKI